MPYLKVHLLIVLRLEQLKDCNKFTLICLGACMILQGKLDKKIFQKVVFNLRHRAFWAKH